MRFETSDLDQACRDIASRVQAASRPVVMVGAGVRIGGAQARLLRLLDAWKIPVVTCWNSHDLVPDCHPSFAGRPGSIGNRPGNFAVQNADLILVLGSRLNIRQVSYAWKYFARNAYKIMVDIDAAELKKPTIVPDLAVHAHVGEVLDRLLAMPAPQGDAHPAWLAWCRERLELYPACLPEYWASRASINPYCFASALFDILPEDEVVVTGDGSACVVTFQAACIKPGQRLYTNSGCAAMGYDLPAAIGACIGAGGKRVVCLAGDGSIQMNLQELQTIVGNRLPIKIFVLNNLGYHSIRQTQHNFFPDNNIGHDEASGVHFADIGKIAEACGMPFRRCADLSRMSADITATLDGEGPQMCEVMLDPAQPFAPKVSSRRLPDGRMVSAPLEDMYPFLSREELARNMLVPILAES
jgi:acetolactate synthase-1/2/3 large subunit